MATKNQQTNFSIYSAIDKEVIRAERKHPEFPKDILHQVAILNEESGEVTKAALQHVYEKGYKSWIKLELIQTAAMCVRMLKSMEPTITNEQ